MWTRCFAVALSLVLLSACGDDSSRSLDEPNQSSATTGRTSTRTSESTVDQPTARPREPGTQIDAATGPFGQMLYDSTGQAIYLFDIETDSTPRCYDDCADAWPPVLTTGDPVAGPGVDSTLLATTQRADGTTQVTYNGHPLYFYVNEGKREVLCHNIFLNGGNWYVIAPDGEPAPPG
ncbi:MAG: hypothetical protein C0482_17635 [Gordonia sp.]|nr:hypothetical protein [Gordonia sp. (in: high G+C Gram-positive bacteria)]